MAEIYTEIKQYSINTNIISNYKIDLMFKTQQGPAGINGAPTLESTEW